MRHFDLVLPIQNVESWLVYFFKENEFENCSGQGSRIKKNGLQLIKFGQNCLVLVGCRLTSQWRLDEP